MPIRISQLLRTSFWTTVALGTSLSLVRAEAALPAHPVVDLQLIEQTAEQAIRAQAAQSAGRLSLTPAPLDPRLRLPLCDRPLQAFITEQGQVRPQTAVGVRCTGSVRWTVYTSISVRTLAPVLVARYALPNAATLTAADFQRCTCEVPGLLTGYVTDAAALAGQRLRRALFAGEPLSIDALAPAPLIRRGQQVVLLARADGIEVRMAGVALSDGRADDHIRVENLSSHRIVEGVVRSGSVVETPL